MLQPTISTLFRGKEMQRAKTFMSKLKNEWWNLFGKIKSRKIENQDQKNQTTTKNGARAKKANETLT
jgi:hypothetical protein